MKKNLQRKILITAGPTREYIDPVRYISNDSTGKMGIALGEAALNLGLKTTIICGPISIATPNGAKIIDVISAKDMRSAVLEQYKNHDIIIMCAAVADFSPVRKSSHKVKKDKSSLEIKLKHNKDILMELGKRKSKSQTLVGFALETENLKKNALNKMKNKGCDWIIANDAKTIGKDKSKCYMFDKDGNEYKIPQLPKTDIAKIIMSYLIYTR